MENKFICPTCGSELAWGGSNMCSEVSDDYSEDDSAVSNNYTCPNCGTFVETYEPTEEDRKQYPFWQRKN